jgi:SAM-dependent methyltransferase/glycosyltransferase involved in cell wall biosynthesis
VATVSILIPAHRREFVDQAIASALAQTFDDIEVIVGDNTQDGELESICRAFDNPKLKYCHHGFDNGDENGRALWAKASGRYVKWLFYDDVLLPQSVEVLLNALRANPQSVMAFHERVWINARGAVINTPQRLLEDGQVKLMDRDYLAHQMIARIDNYIGEPSFIMLDKDRIDLDSAIKYKGHTPEFLGDVYFYLAMAEIGPIAAVGGYFGCIRKHSHQHSNEHHPTFSAALFEWELLLRGEASAGRLGAAELEQARQRLAAWYSSGWFVRRIGIPEIARFAANLDELVDRPPQELFDSEQFTTDLAHGFKAVAVRVAAGKNKALAAQKYCVICESPVQAWQLQPVNQDLAAMMQIGSPNPTLDNALCPHCSCNDRERHLWLYLDQVGLLSDLNAKRVLDISPDAGVRRKIRERSPLEYITGDPFSGQAEDQAWNVQKLDFPDEYFDLILCNQVLERAAHPDKVLAEMARCLSPNGFLVAQTPYSPILKQTFELTIPINEQFSAYCFGKKDRLRLFGVDIMKRFRAAGLYGDLYPHASILDGLSGETVGCNEAEPFFLFSKNPQPLVFSD